VSDDDEPTIAHLRFASAAFAGEVIPIGGMYLTEALNEPYHLRVTVALLTPDADVTAFVGQDCTLDITRRATQSARRICGVIRTATEGEQEHDLPVAQLEIVPGLWFLSQRRDTRIFQEMTAPEILEAVLGEALGDYGRAVTNELEAEYPTREYCVQYGETDLAFCHRLMEEEGISYAFDHEGETEVMVLRDRNASFGELPTGATVRYEPHNQEISDHEPIARFVRTHRARSSTTVVRDWNWTLGGDMSVENEARDSGPDDRDRERYEHGRGRSLSISSYDEGVRRYQEEDSETQAAARKEAHEWDGVLARAMSRVIGIAPGVTFELAGHPVVGMDGRYLITRAEHASDSLGRDIPGGGRGDPYMNRFECIPLDTPYRPDRRTPKPSIPSIQTAVVTGPSGEEIHVDEHGRIKVQFHWDREGQNDENSSCWIRVQQPWAGPGWGFWWVPRIGMEVVVHFIDGDPDRPLCTASVYNGTHPTPYALPDDKTKSTIKSNSSLGGGGFNEFRFEDLAGEEEIYTHAQKDYNEVVENDHNTLVHHDQTNTVDNNQTQEIHNDQTEMVHGKQEMTVDGNRTVVVHTNFDETVDGTETRHTKGDVTETFDATETRTISGDVTETISGDETRTISANHDETISGSHTQTVLGSATEAITASLTEEVSGGITEITPASYDINALGGMNVTAQGGILLVAPGGMQIVAPGGVTRVDSFFANPHGLKKEIGAFASAVFIMKGEACGVAMGVTLVKIEDNLIQFANEPVNIVQELTGLSQDGINIETGAVKLANEQDVNA